MNAYNYVVHPAIIVPPPTALSGITMDLLLKFLWVTPIAVVMCCLVAYPLRKLSVVRSILQRDDTGVARRQNDDVILSGPEV